jgi:hypothetical protein
MPETEYTKILSRPEARHRYWHIHKDNRIFFPEQNEEFKLKFDGNTYVLKVNHKDDIMTGKLYEEFRFLSGDRIIVRKTGDGTYELDAPDTQPY